MKDKTVNEIYESGLACMRQKAYHQAIQHFNEILDKREDYAPALSERAVARFHLDDLQGALDDMNRAQSLEPRNPYRYASRAFIREMCGDTKGAIDDYREALRLDPEDAISYNNLGLLEEKLGYHRMAQQRYKQADLLADSQGLHYADLESSEVKVKALLEELDIQRDAGKPQPSLWKLLFSVFTSRKNRADYFRFLRSLFRKPAK